MCARRWITSTFVGLTVLSCAPAVTARDGIWVLGVSAGTLGVGPDIGYRFGERFGLRANGAYLTYERDEEIDDIEYRGDLQLDSYGVLADWYPFGGGFRISLGGRFNNNELALESTSATSVTVGDGVYTPEQIGTLTGIVITDDFSPMLTLGYGGELATGFTLGIELGVLFQGTPRVHDLQATGLLAGDPVFAADLQREQERIAEEVDNYEYWPILQVQFLYRF